MTTLEKPALKMVTLSINGQSLSVPAGFTILKAARSAGVYIPTLCDHPSLEPFGGCRLCIVEVKGMRGLPTACSTPVNEGMEVATDTVQLRELRKNILELILCEHPHACLTCERKERCGPFDVCLRNVAVNERCVLCVKNQNCELQRVADYIGVKGWQVSLPYNYRNLGILRDSPFFDRDYNLCILCGRCVRVCQDVRGASAIAFTYRGSQALVGTAFGKDLKDSGCVFCMACVEVCPTGALVDRDAWQTKGIKCEDLIVPCSHACPAHIDIPRYVYLAADKRYTEALSVIREKVPFPGSLGRVCIHPCEEACRRGALNQPVSIKELKRAAADLGKPDWRAASRVAPLTGKKVAVIGAGPAGLTAAFYLAKSGHKVTVFESLPEAGGMMRVGIPEYRLPRAILRDEIKVIEEHGVQIMLNHRVESFDGLFKDGYDAVLLAIGAHQGSKMRVHGEDLPGVMDGAFFLREVNLGRKVPLGKKVAVIGGGNSAIDSARVALRAGASEVVMLYRRTRAEMPAANEEIEEALQEGIHIEFLVAPKEIKRVEYGISLECLRMRLGKPDPSGRRQPEPLPGSEFAEKYDAVIAAIGQSPEVPAGFGIKVGRGNTIAVSNDELLDTSKKGVFAAGDAVTGPASVIEAIAAGRKAATSIDIYLGGSGAIDEALAPADDRTGWIGPREGIAYAARVEGALMDPKERINGFPEVKAVMSEPEIICEANRCLRCDLRLKLPKVELPPMQH